MENKLNKEVLDNIMKKICNPFSETFQVETDKNQKQWAHNLEENGSLGKKFEIIYEEGAKRISDGLHKSNLFNEGFVAANFIDEGAPIPIHSHHPFIILKEQLI